MSDPALAALVGLSVMVVAVLAVVGLGTFLAYVGEQRRSDRRLAARPQSQDVKEQPDAPGRRATPRAAGG